MSELEAGQVVSVDGKVVTVKSRDTSKKIKESEFSADYEPNVGDSVEFVHQKGQFKQVRLAGHPYTPREREASKTPNSQPEPREPVKSSTKPTSKRRDFLNPKNFVPTPRRPTSGDLADGYPHWHDHAHDGHISGSITVRAKVVTPLLILDSTSAESDKNSHRTFKMRVVDDNVVIAGSSLKGAIRSAFEAITNSRMSVFSQTSRLTFRPPPVGGRPQRKETHKLSPLDVLRQDLRPAPSIDKLSPADRLFGWVAGGKEKWGAVKGRVAFDEARIPTSFLDSTSHTLAILNGPKPQQVRFYLGVEDESGTPRAFEDKADINGLRYDSQKLRGRIKSLRGRAIYERHESAAADSKDRSNQNITVQNSVKVDSEFVITIHLFDVAPVDAGALLWILDGGTHNVAIQLGHAKPLGYGTTMLSIETLDLRTTEQIREDWLTWQQVSSDPNLVESLIARFRSVSCEVYGKSIFEEVPHIAAYLAALGDPTGKLPIHYPRRSEGSDPHSKHYEWFTRNEKGPKVALPDLGGDIEGLPYMES